MLRRTASRGVLAIAAAGIALWGPGPETVTVHDCAYRGWRRVELGASVFRLRGFLRNSGSAAANGLFVVAGRVVDPGTRETLPPTILHLPDTVIDPPAGDHHFATPLLAVDHARRIHMVWGEPHGAGLGAAPNPDRQPEVTRILYARRDTSGSWSRPVVVASGHVFLWERGLSSMVVDDQGRVHVAIGLWAEDIILYARLDGGEWQLRHLRATSAGHPTLLATPGDTLRMAFAALGEQPHGHGSVYAFVSTSVDGGRSWREPRQAMPLARRMPTGLLLLRSTEGTFRMVFGESSDGNLLPDRIRIRSSTDFVSWEQGAALEAPGPFSHLQALVDRCGVVHVGFEVWDGVAEQLFVARWQEGWTTPARPFPFRDLTEASLALGHHGILLFAMEWRGDPAAGDIESAPFLAELPIFSP